LEAEYDGNTLATSISSRVIVYVLVQSDLPKLDFWLL